MMPADTASLQNSVQRAVLYPDAAWYRLVIQNDLCNCKLSPEEEAAVLDGAVQTAAMTAQHVQAQFGSPSPQELLAALNIKLLHVEEELREPYLYMGLYEPHLRTITLNESAISGIRQFINDNELAGITPAEDVERIVLFHEIFHTLEEETPEIYTRSRMLKRKALGVFPYVRGLASASEIAAIHFSKLMAGVFYSPCLFERYLLLSIKRIAIDFWLPNV